MIKGMSRGIPNMKSISHVAATQESQGFLICSSLTTCCKIRKYAPGGAKAVNSKFGKGIFLESDRFQVGHSN